MSKLPQRLGALVAGLTVIAGLAGLGAATAMAAGPADSTVTARLAAPNAEVGTWFSYQGQLADGGGPLTGSCAFQFQLYNAEQGGQQIGQTLGTNDAVNVEDGLVHFGLNFGDVFNGEERWLQIGVNCGGPGYATLSPRTAIRNAPYALYAQHAPWTGIVGKNIGAGTGLDYNNHVFQVDFGLVQRRVQEACPQAQAMRQINADGSVSCVAVGGGQGNGLELPFEGTVNLNQTAFKVTNQGNGFAIYGQTNGVNAAVFGDSRGNGHAVLGLAGGNGSGGFFQVTSTNSGTSALVANTKGTGPAATIFTDNTNTSSPALSVTTGSNNTQGQAIKAVSQGRGSAGLFQVNNTNSGAAAVYGTTNTGGVGSGVYGVTTNSGFGVRAEATSGSNATPLVAVNNGNPNGNIAIFQSQGTNQARISSAGRGFFNGGTQQGGADVAEAFQVEGWTALYTPGDVLAISTRQDARVTLADAPYSTLVVGVYATRPGVLLTERHIDADLSDTVPLGVVGVIPTKVTAENGPIRRGDLLVTAATAGHAMKGTDTSRMMGAVLGKALENFDGPGSGTIRVLVNVR